MTLTLFQWLACSGLLLVLLVEILRLRRGGQQWGSWALRSAVWLAALIAIADPDLTQRIARVLGISRGADVVFYSFVLAFLGTTFHFTSRHTRLQRQVNALASHLAIQGAQRGSPPSRPGDPKA